MLVRVVCDAPSIKRPHERARHDVACPMLAEVHARQSGRQCQNVRRNRDIPCCGWIASLDFGDQRRRGGKSRCRMDGWKGALLKMREALEGMKLVLVVVRTVGVLRPR